MTTTRELTELRDRIRAVTFMPEISAEEARFRIGAILEYAGYIPDAGSGESLERLCRAAGVSQDEALRIRERTQSSADAPDWPDQAEADGRGEITATYTFEFASDGIVYLSGDVPMDAAQGQIIIGLLRERFGGQLPDVAGPEVPRPAGGKPRLRIVGPPEPEGRGPAS
jgi:hypothetical protein